MRLRASIASGFAALCLLIGSSASAAPRAQARCNAEDANAHLGAARMLRANGDLDGARLELEAAYVSSCDAKIFDELASLRVPRARLAMGPTLLPVSWASDLGDGLAEVVIHLVESRSDDLMPVPWRKR